MKDFLENPALLVGIPLLALGIGGLAAAAMLLLIPEPQMTPQQRAVAHAHPGPEEYIRVGLALAVITLFEVGIYYLDINRQLFVAILIGAAAAKFILVVLFFMHLKFDSRLFSTAFITGRALALAVFTVVIATLGANLV